MSSRCLSIGLTLAVLFGWGAHGLLAAAAGESHVAAEAEPGASGHDDEHSDGADAAHDSYEVTLHGNAGKNLDNVAEVRGSLALWTLVVFGLLLTVLWKFAWGPLAAALDRREMGILANIEEAKKRNEEAVGVLAQHEARLAGAADEVRGILDDARREADTQKQQILAEAQAAADAEKQRALREIDAAKNGALQELAEKSVDTAVGLAGKIVQRQLSRDDHAALIADALEHFPGRN